MKNLVIACCFLVFNFYGFAQMNEEPDKIISISRELKCDVQTAFGYFTQNALLEKWLTNTADVEPSIGGKYELFWTPDDPDKTNNSTYGCRVLSVDAPYHLTVEWRGNREQKSFMNQVRPLTTVTFIFTPISQSTTRITLLHTGWRQGDDWEGARVYFVHAWTSALNTLEAQFL